MQPYFEQDFFAVYFDEVNKIIIAEWRIPPTSQEFRNSMDVMIDAFQFFNTGKIVFDTLALGVLPQSDQEWISNDWYRRAVNVGYMQVAFVLPSDIFTKMFVKESVERTSDRIPTAYFESRSAAMDWMIKA